MVLRKKVLSLGKMRTILFHKKDFFLCICIFNIDRGVFNVKSQFFHVLKTLCSVCSFLGTFLYKIIQEPVKKILENKVSLTLFFICRTFQCQNLGLYFRKLFLRDLFCWLPQRLCNLVKIHKYKKKAFKSYLLISATLLIKP